MVVNMDAPPVPEKRVLVFGGTGEGKTSLLNCLTGENKPTSSEARGCTFQTDQYTPRFWDNCNWTFYDTVGLNEPGGEDTSHAQAVKNLIDLLRTSTEGFNLIIMVMKQGKITATLEKNYELFVEGVSHNQVPVIGVVTGCENVEPMQRWVEENDHHFRMSKLRFGSLTAGCCAVGGRFEGVYSELRQITRASVWQAVTRAAAPEPVIFLKEENAFRAKIRQIINVLWQWWYRETAPSPLVNQPLYEELKKWMPEKDALGLASKFVS